MASKNMKLYEELKEEILKHISSSSLPSTIESLVNQIKDNNSRYGLVWSSEQVKEKVEQDLCEGFVPYFNHITDLSVNQNASHYHTLIEGDNYHALKVLQTTHLEKINVIYIDPPYNTGNKDFKYNDKFVDTEDSYRHSKWLSFMKKRLLLAKSLLSDDGVIFLSIDNNEFAQLKLLCDEIFGENNFISNLVWKKKNGGGNDSKFVINEHEYILLYAKNVKSTFFKKDTKATVKMKYPNKDETGYYQLERLDKQSLGYLKSLDFPIFDKQGKKYIVKQKDSNNPNARWRWSEKKVKENFDQLVFKNGNVYTKNYQKQEYLATSILYDERFGRTQSGKILLQKIINKDVFTYPKPLDLIKHLLRISTKQNSIILDFFAGSGTTGHAVLDLNKEDRGNRQFIMCTNNESNICKDITLPRLTTVINGYGKQPAIDVGLQYYQIGLCKTESSVSSFIFQKQYMEKLHGVFLLKENIANYHTCINNDSYTFYKNNEKSLIIIEDTDLFYENILKNKEIIECNTKILLFNYFKNNRFDVEDDVILHKRFKNHFSNKIEIIPKEIINKILGE